MCGLLNRMGSGDVEFAHLSFQEFLAAKHMLDRDIDYKKYLENPWWKEALLLYTGLMNLDMKKRSNDMIHEMLDDKAPLRIQLLGAEALRDFQSSRREEAVVKKAIEKLLDIIKSDAGLQERFNAGEILGGLGDPRINVLEPAMVEIPAGEFIRGSNEDDREKPVRKIYLDAFEIGKYPVTNLEFKAFVDDKGYDNEGIVDAGRLAVAKERKYFRTGIIGMTGNGMGPISRWWGSAGMKPLLMWSGLSRKTGNKYALPSEAQWEKAARGSAGFLYPWGEEWQEDRCNSDECGLGPHQPGGYISIGRQSVRVPGYGRQCVGVVRGLV